MFYPSLEEARRLAEGYSVIPVALELMGDIKTPIQILRTLQCGSERCFILESVISTDNWSRYSFLGYEPPMTISGSDGVVTTTKNGVSESRSQDPIKLIREILSGYKSPAIDRLPPFTGGFVGYFSYDFVKYTQPAPVLAAANNEGFDDFRLMLIDKVIAFDHLKQKIFLIVNISTEHLERNYVNAVAELKDMERLVMESRDFSGQGAQCGRFSALFPKVEFCRNVEILQHHIREGDIFQAVLSNRFTAPFTGSLLETYRILRTTNPSPYMVYMRIDDLEIACASPETLVSLRDGKLSSFPLAGTRPRGENEAENARRAEELLKDEKELSEHDMLVDLARNDLGKISVFGSVKVDSYHQVKPYSHVMHIASMVTGDMAEGKDALDAVTAALPAGTLSGAPKKKACELVDGLEKTKRGPYGGAMGYMDFTGNADFCIGIRMAVRKGNKVFVQAGAGIVADSRPESEYKEMLYKVQGVMNALQGGRGEQNDSDYR
ncbi:MAG: anthranilate synthase component I family protein [Syntrophomonadaceae bacterium]|nr:anthranilate synthase component I family protein [Syntrophomonadaceae bacterium]